MKFPAERVLRIRTILLVCECCLLVTLPAWCQTAPSKTDAAPAQPENAGPAVAGELAAQLRAVRDAALSSDYAWKQLAHLTENIGPRPSGSPQFQAAAEYVAAELRKLGLEVKLEPAQVSHWMRGEEQAQLVTYPGQAPGTTQRIVLAATSGSSATPTSGITTDIIVVHDFDELQALGRDKIAGKIVLYEVRYDERKARAGHAFEAYGEVVLYRVYGARRAAALGAVASLVRSAGGADYRLAHTGFSLPSGIPDADVAAEDADLIDHLAAQGPVRMHLVLTPQNLPPTIGYNVVADLKGSEHPEQIVVVSGHLDSWDLGRGAMDDGAGVAIIMETAEALQRLHLHPRRTLRIIVWADEENGGGGHKAYAEAHAAELANHIAAIECDAGAAHPLGFALKMPPEAVEALHPVLGALDPIGATILQPMDESPGADIEPLVEAGVPGLGLDQDGERYFDYHHTAADTLDKVDPRELRESAAATAVIGYFLAETPNPLPRSAHK